MLKIKYFLSVLVYSIIISFAANSFIALKDIPWLLLLIIPIFLCINLFAGFGTICSSSKRLRICYHGAVLLTCFCVSVTVSVLYHVFLAFQTIPNEWGTFLWGAVLCFSVNFILFWNGIICVYLTSLQLGMKLRLIGVICGMIPTANLIVLFIIIKATVGECFFESSKEEVNRRRKKDSICATKYPLLMVHGVFFRDSKYFNYWGRIPKELEANGARIYYGNHSSAASVADSAAELKLRIEEILAETGANKLNIIAHSKGGLDCRYAISKLGIGSKVASLTTINTPHRGCLFADYLLTKIDPAVKNKVAATYNSTLKRFGDTKADFLAAVNDLTDASCRSLDVELTAPQEVLCQSVGSVMKKAGGGKFPLNLSYHLVKHFDGENDGLVSENSFSWGESYRLLKPSGKCGISHGDMIDLNRTDIDGFDVREFYVELVNNLKKKGL